jgi:hypothetical protein
MWGWANVWLGAKYFRINFGVGDFDPDVAWLAGRGNCHTDIQDLVNF